MSDIQKYGGSSSSGSPLDVLTFSGQLVRRTGRELATIDAKTTVAIAQMDSAAELQAMKLGVIGAVAQKAMGHAALLSNMEATLAQAVPHASGRLATIADLATVGLAQIVAETPSRLGRRS